LKILQEKRKLFCHQTKNKLVVDSSFKSTLQKFERQIKKELQSSCLTYNKSYPYEFSTCCCFHLKYCTVFWAKRRL